ncbi:hypothetical protein MMC31_006963 [Peltigera leucophlebia]|nr:hypothetical protein [Peltigera leucophlebia]
MLSMTRKYYWQRERRVSRAWRIVLMVVMFAEIVACVTIRGVTDSSRSWEFPFPCLAAEHLIGLPSGKQAFWTASELFLICYQYIFGILGLFRDQPRFSRWISIDGTEVLLANMKGQSSKLKARRRWYSSLLIRGLLGAPHAILLSAVVCASSECMGTILYGVWIGWVLKNIFTLRTSVPPLDVIAAEAQVGFGQTVSFLLLLSTGRVLHEAFNDQVGLRNEAATRVIDPAISSPSTDISDLEPAQGQNSGTLGVELPNAPGRRRSFNSQDERQT